VSGAPACRQNRARCSFNGAATGAALGKTFSIRFCTSSDEKSSLVIRVEALLMITGLVAIGAIVVTK